MTADLMRMAEALEDLARWIDTADGHHDRLTAGGFPPPPVLLDRRRRLREAYTDRLDAYYTALGPEIGP